MELAVTTREKFGRAVKSLRKDGLLPAELYGHGLENLHVAVPLKEFNKVFKEAGENTVVTLVVGGEKRPALVHNVQHHFLTGEVTHVDFYQVRMDEVLAAKIPLEFVGEAPAVREQGAVLNKAMSELEVEALPQDLPHRLTVDISTLVEMNQSIYVRDIAVPEGVKVLVEGDMAVITATPPAAEEVVEAAPVDVSTVKVESEEKKAERDAGKTEKEE